jgi:hypothetical protein
VNLFERTILDMGSSWTPTGQMDVGIDGFVELFHPATGEAVGTIVAAQSKAVTAFQNETDDGFDYWCEQRDVNYWMRGNMPVILVLSRPAVGDLYWIDIKKHFGSPENAGSTRIRFSKTANRLTNDSLPDLMALGKPWDAGLYLARFRRPSNCTRTSCR